MIINHSVMNNKYKCDKKIMEYLVYKCNIPILSYEGDFFYFAFTKKLKECIDDMPLFLKEYHSWAK